MGAILSVYNNKGGSGKTTSTISLAGCFADFGNKKVLVVDADGQCNLTEALTGGQGDIVAGTLKNAIETGSLNECIHTCTFDKRNKKTGRLQGKYTIDIVRGDRYIESLEDDDVHSIRRLIEEVREDYDIILIDINPVMTGLTITSLLGSDFVITPSMYNIDHIQGISKTMDLIKTIRDSGYSDSLEMLGVYITMHKKNNSLEQLIKENALESLGGLLFRSETRNTAILAEAAYTNMPVNSLQVTHPVVKDYHSLSLEILQRLEERLKEGGYGYGKE